MSYQSLRYQCWNVHKRVFNQFVCLIFSLKSKLELNDLVSGKGGLLGLFLGISNYIGINNYFIKKNLKLK